MKDFLLVDFEFTTYTKPVGRPRGFFSEIIEIGAVKLTGAELKEDGKIQNFVKPHFYPKQAKDSMDFCMITEKDMKKGIEYPEMVAKLTEIYEAGQTYFVAWGTEDFTKGPAMTREQAEMALERGMKVAGECIDKGYNMLVTAEMGIGNTTSTAAIVSAFTGLAPELTVGRGTGINDERMKVKRQVVADGLAVNKPELGNAMDILCKVGGYDHAGLAGMIIEGARRRVPTMVDGVNATAAALLAYGIEPACADYMFCSHLSAEISHAKMLEILNLKPIVDAGMRLGEGTGASLAIVILQSALDLYKNLTAGEHNA